MAQEPMQKCADCKKDVPVSTRKGAKNGRWFCSPCFYKNTGTRYRRTTFSRKIRTSTSSRARSDCQTGCA